MDAQIAPALIVGVDDDDIRSFGLNQKGTEDTEGNWDFFYRFQIDLRR